MKKKNSNGYDNHNNKTHAITSRSHENSDPDLHFARLVTMFWQTASFIQGLNGPYIFAGVLEKHSNKNSQGKVCNRGLCFSFVAEFEEV